MKKEKRLILLLIVIILIAVVFTISFIFINSPKIYTKYFCEEIGSYDDKKCLDECASFCIKLGYKYKDIGPITPSELDIASCGASIGCKCECII